MKRAICTYVVFIIIIFSSYSLYAQRINPEAEALFKKAEAAFKSKDLDSAESFLTQSLKIEPENAYTRYILGQVQFMKKEFLESRSNFEIVQRSRPSPDKGEEYNNRLKSSKQRVRDLQKQFNQAGQQRFSLYEQNKSSSDALRLAVTLYQAFRLNPPLRYRNFQLLETAIEVYEKALQSSFEGRNWQKEPMQQLAFLYEIANQRDKAAEVYMRALDYVEDANEEFIITHRFDYLNRSNKEKLLDTIEAGEFTSEDLEELIGASDKKISDEDKAEIEDIISEARVQLQEATSDFEREQVLEDIKATILDKQRRGELPGQDELEKKLEAEGKTMDDYLKEKGL